MKITHKKVVTVTLEMNEWEAVALAQLCVQVGGEPGARRDFYHEVWREIRKGMQGDIPSSRGVFTFSDRAILVAPEEKKETPSGSVAK